MRLFYAKTVLYIKIVKSSKNSKFSINYIFVTRVFAKKIEKMEQFKLTVG